MDKAQESNPIANREFVLLAPDYAGMHNSPRGQLEIVVVYRTHYPTQFGCQFQVFVIIKS